MNRRKKKSKKLDDVTYWQTQADLLSALVLILILFLMLFMLSLLSNRNAKDPEPGAGGTTSIVVTNQSPGEKGQEQESQNSANSGGGEGGGGETERETTTERETYLESRNKHAVYVMIIDDESKNVIREAGVSFELYNTQQNLEVLNTYYPQRIEYKKFDTTEDGTFYLPEKVQSGDYFLKNIVAPKGYDLAEDYSFELLQEHDWGSPYVVRIPMSAYKNTIHLKVTDKDTGANVAGSTYEVYAEQDIVTADGTKRYSAGEHVDTIVCDRDGEGESRPIYLGEYKLCQSTIPKDYAGDLEFTHVTLEKKEKNPVITEIKAEKALLTVRLIDEIYPENRLQDAVYELKDAATMHVIGEYTTNAKGEFVVKGLQAGKNYYLSQLNGPLHDRVTDNIEHLIVVDSKRRINDEAQYVLQLTNRVLYLSVETESNILHRNLTGYDMHLCHQNGTFVKNWISSSKPEMLSGLEPGDYYITSDQTPDIKIPVKVSDSATVHVAKYNIPLRSEWVMIIALAVLIIFAVVMAVIVAHKKKKKKQEEKDK